LHILITNQQRSLSIDIRSVRTAVIEALHYLGVSCDEISLQFVSTKKIKELHKAFFNDPTTTDCITFPCSFTENEPYKVLGEVFICPKTAHDYALEHSKDPYLETTLYLVHGILHLLGYDDINEIDRKVMRSMEKKCMKHLQGISATIKNAKQIRCKKLQSSI
jgi:probable rRNA maturation factor